MVKIAFRIFILIFLVTTFTLAGSAVIFLTRNVYKRRYRLSRILRFFCKYIALPAFGFKIEQNTLHNFQDQNTFLAVSNHLSYTDVIVYSTLFPCIFVSSVEIQHTFFLGFMSTLGGTYFVERRTRDRIGQEIAEIGQTLASGVNIMIFPEATSSDGESVLPFKRSLLKSAIDSNVPVVPMCLAYTHTNEQPVTAEERKRLCYYGDTSFFGHLMNLLKQKSVTVQVKILEPIMTEPNSDRKVITAQAYEKILKTYTELSSHRIPQPC